MVAVLNPEALPFEKTTASRITATTHAKFNLTDPSLSSHHFLPSSAFPSVQLLFPHLLYYSNFLCSPPPPLNIAVGDYSMTNNINNPINSLNPNQTVPQALRRTVFNTALKSLTPHRSKIMSMAKESRRFQEGFSRVTNKALAWRRKLNATQQALEFNEAEPVKTTIMIKNIPNRFREMLLGLLDKHCVKENNRLKLESGFTLSEYDFVYLPMDFKNKCNLGYAFVNFTTATATLRFHKALHNHPWKIFNTKKICKISYGRIQGKSALEEHFRKSHFRCDSDQYLPILFTPARSGTASSVPTLVGRRTVYK